MNLQNKNRPEHGYIKDLEQRHAEGDGSAPHEGVPAVTAGVTRAVAVSGLVYPKTIWDAGGVAPKLLFGQAALERTELATLVCGEHACR